jgi:ribosomal-protein-alanine N-acetyltransferase
MVKVEIEFAQYADILEMSMISRSDIEYDLGWRYTPERISRFLKSNTKNVVVARVKSELAGFGIMTYQQDQANLDLLAVKRHYRRSCIGTRIVEWLEKVARNAGIYNIFVQVREKNHIAIAFYKRNGFINIDTERDYYQGIESAVIMSKNLRPMFRHQ